MHHFYGWRPDIPDSRDQYFSAPLRVLQTLPRRADLREACPPVYDQGSLGSCTANALAAAHEFDQRRQALPRPFAPSRLFIYYNERVIEKTVPYDAGARLRDGFKTIARNGVCPESEWPYDIAAFSRKPTAACYKAALRHQALSYQRLQQTPAQLKGCIADGYPFAFGFAVHESFESDEVARTGVVPLPAKGEAVLGGHAVLAVGYEDASQAFIIRNSWGTQWGESGYGYMPYSYLTDNDLSADFWTLRLVEGA